MYTRIVVPLDGSDIAEQALASAEDLARATGATLHLVRIVEFPSTSYTYVYGAMIEGEATVKRYYPEGDRIRFQPANARMEPIFVHKSEFRQTDILGIVVGVYRRM